MIKKYAVYLLGVILFSLKGMAMEGNPIEIIIDEGGKVTGTSPHFTFHSIEEGDSFAVEGTVKQCSFKEGLPDNPVSWSENLIKRQNGGNPYSALILKSGIDTVGVLGFGRMPVLNYDPKFTDIINTYVELGVTYFENPQAAAEEKYAKDNVKRVENQGLGVLLPILPESLGDMQRRQALEIGIEVFKELKKAGYLLPLEKTAPAYLIGLYHPDDTLIPLLQQVGFTILRKDGFKGYYSTDEVIKERVMAYLKLS